MISNFTNDKINELYEYSIEVLFEEYYTMAYKKALSMLPNEEYAKDAVQEAFIKAFLNMNELKNKSKFKAWICTIIKNVCIDMLRQTKRLKAKNESIYDEDGNLKNLIELQDFDVPDAICENAEIRKEIKECIDELDSDSQQVINLRFFYDYTYEQIAEHMNININTVKVKLYRAKKRLADKLENIIEL